MRSAMGEMVNDFAKGMELPGIDDNLKAKDRLQEQEDILSFLQSCVETGLGREIPLIGEIEVNTKEDSIACMLAALENSLKLG